MKRFWRTLQLIFYALLPVPEKGARPPLDGNGGCAPRAIRSGGPRPTNRAGELTLLFPDCFSFAGPALLFRLKREGFSRCTVVGREGGLLVRGWR